MMLDAMKTTRILSLIVASLGLFIPMLVSSCATPDPTLQKQMDRDILSAAENKAPGNTTGSQQGQGSKNYGYGGF